MKVYFTIKKIVRLSYCSQGEIITTNVNELLHYYRLSFELCGQGEKVIEKFQLVESLLWSRSLAYILKKINSMSLLTLTVTGTGRL